MNLSFKKKPKDELSAAEIDLRAKLLEATIAAVEGKWAIVESRLEDARILNAHVRQAAKRAVELP